MRAFSINAPNGPVAGIETGDGPPLVVLAGLGSTTRIWGSLPELLGRSFRVLAVDNRGVGGSRSGAPFSLAGAVEDLRAVLDARGIERAALLGASMGGVIALNAAISAPERLSRMVVVSAPTRLTRHGRRMFEMFRDLMLYAPPDRVGAGLMAVAFAPPFHERHPGFVDEAAGLYGLDEADLPGALTQVEHLLAGWDLRPDLGSIEVPTLVVHGRRDPVVAPELGAELAAAVAGSELVEVPGAAHSVLAEGGGEILDRIVRFLLSEAEPPPPAVV